MHKFALQNLSCYQNGNLGKIPVYFWNNCSPTHRSSRRDRKSKIKASTPACNWGSFNFPPFTHGLVACGTGVVVVVGFTVSPKCVKAFCIYCVVCVLYVCQCILYLIYRVCPVPVSMYFAFTVSCVSCTCVNVFCTYCVVCVLYVCQCILHLIYRVCLVRVSMHFEFTMSCVSCTCVNVFCIYCVVCVA